MLAGAAARRREIGLRLSLGASRGRIVRQLLTESVLVSLAGGALGVLVGHWGNRLWPLGGMEEMPYYISFVIDGAVLLYTTVITVLAGILFGLAPAIHAAGENFTEALREGSAQTGASARGGRLRNAFVIAEVALSLVLLVGAGLMVRSFQSLTSQGDRVQPEGVVPAQVLLPIASYPNDGQMRRFFREFVARVRSAPGVHEVAGMSALPLGNSSDTRVVMTPDTKDKRDGVPVNYGTILPGSLHLLHLDIVRGRDFTTEDDTTAAKIAIVNQALAAKLYPGKDPIGQRLRFIGEPDSIPWRRIVGVMPDIMLDVMDSKPTAYQVWVPELQETQQFMAMLVRADGDGATGASAMRQAMKALDPTLPLMDLRTMREQMNYALWVKRLLSMMVGIVAILALIIAAVGLYGVVAYSVVQRTREIGIRMALGADPANVLRMVVGQSMRLTLIGLGIGLAGAFALTRFIGGVINGVSPTDPPTFTVVAVVLALSGVFAAWVPANRATRIDPMRALRVD